MIIVPDVPSAEMLRAHAEEWIVAVTIASEVPPRATKSPNSAETFTKEMIPLALEAVALTIANRVADTTTFSDTPLEVVLQPKQFSGTMRGLNVKATGHRDFWLEALAGRWFPEHIDVARDVWRSRRGKPRSDGPLYYYSPVSMPIPGSVPGWAAALQRVTIPGIPADYFSFFR